MHRIESGDYIIYCNSQFYDEFTSRLIGDEYLEEEEDPISEIKINNDE